MLKYENEFDLHKMNLHGGRGIFFHMNGYIIFNEDSF